MAHQKESKRIVYSEPEDYFPKEIRKKYKLGEFAEPEMLRKIKAVMLGHAVGDALGVPVEFCSREELTKNPVTDMRGFGTYPVPAGAWSDDTSMSLATLDSLASGDVHYNEMMENFGKWYYQKEYTPTGEVFDVGGTCCCEIDNYFLGSKNIETCGLTDVNSNGNGSLMRIHSLVLHVYVKNLPFETWRWIIESGSMLTHAHERSILGCLIYSFVLLYLLTCREKSAVPRALREAKKQLQSNPEFGHYERIFADDFADLPHDAIKSSGYVVDTLEAAIWCLLTTDSYTECVLKAVNLGDDTDTVAAVVGGLAGALYGYDAIPRAWLDTLQKRKYIERICERFLER